MTLFKLPASLLKFIRSTILNIRIWFTRLFLDILATGPMPRHISFEMDGNRRYAKRLGKEAKDGHSDGFKTAVLVLGLCLRLRIQCVTLYAFSIENFKRPKEEVDAIMKIAKDGFLEVSQFSETFDKYGVRLNVLGRRELLPPDVQAAIGKAEDMTRQNNTAILNICMPYSSQDEITTAVESSIQEAIDAGDLDGSTITEESIDAHLSTSLAGSPPLDIFVRTSGAKRLSGFLTWQCCEDTQIHILDTLWPDLGFFDLVPILLQYQRKVWAQEQKKRT